ncbi:MAG TPA: hypothetical protein VK666_07550 [Chryseolinea sp.]|nr:hypothetical protein [Chryseolinea sp.]
MKKSLLCALLTLCIAFSANSQTGSKRTGDYLGEDPPGLKPKVFAPGIVSLPQDYEFGSVFSSNGSEFYYAVNVGPIAEIRRIARSANGWSKPVTILTSDKYSHNDPFLSKDGKRLYFISDRPLTGVGEKKDYDIWYVKRERKAWSLPVNAGPAINSGQNEYYVSLSNDGNMYFSSNGRVNTNSDNYDIFSAKKIKDDFAPAVRLDESINTDAYEADVFIAPDESYLIFCADRPDGFGSGDLYVSFRMEDGSWSKSKNMGRTLNTQDNELCPFVTADGKYFFYTSNKEIYWIDAKIIQSLK